MAKKFKIIKSQFEFALRGESYEYTVGEVVEILKSLPQDYMFNAATSFAPVSGKECWTFSATKHLKLDPKLKRGKP